MQVQMMENNIDFTSDDPMDQKGLYTILKKFCLHL